MEQKYYKCLVIVSKCSLVYVEAFLAHKIKKMPKTAKKLLKTAPKHEIFLKEYTVSYYY